ncbi:MAG TPA: peptidase M49 [Acidobacteriota bacterium]
MQRLLMGFILIAPVAAQTAQGAEPASTVVERIGDTVVVRLEARGFEQLSPRQRLLAYHLSRAALAGREIAIDQGHRHAVEILRLMEGIVVHPEGIAAEPLERLRSYAKLLFIHNGFYNHRSRRKFVPEFTPDQLLAAARRALESGADLGITAQQLDARLTALRRTIFDPDFEPMQVEKTPPPGQDVVTASAVNLYLGVNRSEAERFPAHYPLNSRLAKVDGQIVEQVWRAGDAQHPPGPYAQPIERIIAWLRRAMPLAEPQQREALRLLILYYQSGAPAAWRDFNIAWLQADAAVDFTNGFIEVYLDPLGQKGEWESLVNYLDPDLGRQMRGLAANVQSFEDRMPWDPRYKSPQRGAPVAKAIQALLGVGGAGPQTALGVNLPNEQDLRETYGTKSVLLANVIQAYDAASAAAALQEFVPPQEREAARAYSEAAGFAQTAIHEVLGHGSGRVNPALEQSPPDRLKEFYSTIEEARAELVGLHFLFDPKVQELGLVPSPEAAEAGFRKMVRDWGLLQLRRVRHGEVIADDHMRARQLIVEYLRRESGCIQRARRDGKTDLIVSDIATMRAGVAKLLAEVMRIKGEGDFAAAKALVGRYGVRIDPALRDEVVRRVDAIGYPSTVALLMPRQIPVLDNEGRLIDVRLEAAPSLESQLLEFSRLGRELPPPSESDSAPLS